MNASLETCRKRARPSLKGAPCSPPSMRLYAACGNGLWPSVGAHLPDGGQPGSAVAELAQQARQHRAGCDRRRSMLSRIVAQQAVGSSLSCG